MFPDEAACTRYLEELRWPEGFTCPSCGMAGDPQRIHTRLRILRCRQCLEETSVTAGTLMHATRTPLPGVVLGRVSRHLADARNVGPPVPAAARHRTLRDRFPTDASIRWACSTT